MEFNKFLQIKKRTELAHDEIGLRKPRLSRRTVLQALKVGGNPHVVPGKTWDSCWRHEVELKTGDLLKI